MLGRTDRRMRMLALLVVFALFGSAIMVRLGYWQVGRPDLVARAQATMASPEDDGPPRAEIVDRDGTVLAQTVTVDRLDAYPRDIPADQRAGIVSTLAGILDLDAREQAGYLAKLSKEDDPWEWLDLRLTPDESVAVAAARDAGLLPGIRLTPLDARYYPKGGGQAGTTLASQLLGFVAGDSGGAAGVEQAYEARLSGAERGSADVASIAGAAPAATDGIDAASLEEDVVQPLRLTIDAQLQKRVEKVLAAVRIADGAESVSAILLDPRNGEILASASVPTYDANDYGTVAQKQPELLANRTISAVYEPGSVMKAFTVTAALETGKVTPGTIIVDEPEFEVPGGVVKNSGPSIGPAPVRDIIAKSRNVGTSKIAFRMASNHQKAAHILFDLWDRTGMVGRTGVDVAGEEAGIWYDPDAYKWAQMDLANRSFGQGVGVTLMHLATGYAALVNGGYRIQPHVLAADEVTFPRERALDPKLARQVRDILTYVTGSVAYYADGSLVPGYLIGGKTGTAQIWDPARWNRATHTRGDWKPKRFNHTFVGFVGSDEPEVLIAVRIEEAKPIGFDPLDLRVESFELFGMLAREAIKALDIPRSSAPLAGLPIPGTEAARKSVFHAALQAARARAGSAEATSEDGRPEGARTRAPKPGSRGRDGEVLLDPAGDPVRGTDEARDRRTGGPRDDRGSDSDA